MRIELAPMEGITTYIYRNTINKYYGGIDTYYTPFISTHKDKELNFKEKNEIRPENNPGIDVVPQILTADADEFLYTSGQIADFGYKHININFGCPSATVTTKGKGSGALNDIEKLDSFLDKIFQKTKLNISIKTRMGFSDTSQFNNIMAVYSRYPLKELIVHARVREDYYKGKARIAELSEYLKENKFINPTMELSYNGDVFTVADFNKITDNMSNFGAVMIGRGLIANPALALEIKGDNSKSIINDIKTFKDFNRELIDRYNEIMPGEKNTLYKLKELWTFMIKSFEDCPVNGSMEYDFNSSPDSVYAKKLLKSIKKCNSLIEYRRIIDSLNNDKGLN